MVCVPCILLPFFLAIYLKFIQPLLLRMLPESWQTWFNSVLYPTCPVKPPQSSGTQKAGTSASGCPQRQSSESAAGEHIERATNSSSSSSLHDSDDFEHVNDASNGGAKDKEA